MDSNGIKTIVSSLGIISSSVSTLGLIRPPYWIIRTPQERGSPLIFDTLVVFGRCLIIRPLPWSDSNRVRTIVSIIRLPLYSVGTSNCSAPSVDGFQGGPYNCSMLGLICLRVSTLGHFSSLLAEKEDLPIIRHPYPIRHVPHLFRPLLGKDSKVVLTTISDLGAH